MPGAPASSAVMTSEKARPIQSPETPTPRFSKRRMAMRSTDGVSGWRAQPARRSRRSKSGAAIPGCSRLLAGPPPERRLQARLPALQYTRLQGQQFLELRQVAHGLEVGIFLDLLLVLKALFQRLPQILKRQLVAAGLGVQLGHVEMELGALLDVALLQQHTVAAVALEDVGVELERDLVGLHGLFVFFSGEISRAQIGVNRGRVGSVLERPLIIPDGSAEAFPGVVNRPEVVDGFGVIGLEADGLLVGFPRVGELLHLVIGDADFVGDDRVLGLILAEYVDGLAVHLTRHENVAAGLHRKRNLRGLGR